MKKPINSYDINQIKLEESQNDFTEEFIKKFRSNVLDELRNSGFIVNKETLDHYPSKQNLRELHASAVENMRDKYRQKLERKEIELIRYIANGNEITPKDIEPELVCVDSTSKYWDLFNYIKIHWSIPISDGYGRRLRYVVFDKNTNKIMGILGLADPVFTIGNRDNFIGWNNERKKTNMSKIMDGFVIGSTPPYNMVLGGKFVASLLFSNEIRKKFYKKYSGCKSLISGRVHSGDLVLITTLSALGKSAMYDRIRLLNGQQFISVGFSEGYGEFHFNGAIYKNMKKLVSYYNPASRKKKEWGTGFRNKREVVLKALTILKIPRSYCRHGVKREQFLIPLAINYKDALCKNDKPDYYNISVSEISEFMKKRWVIPRAARDPSFKKWNKKSYLLW